MPPYVGPDTVPQQFDRALVAVWGEHAGPAELEEPQVAMALDQTADVEFSLGVEAAVAVGRVLAEQTIGADHGRLALERACAIARPGRRAVVDHQQMVADPVEIVLVAPCQQGAGVGDRGAVLVEHVVAQPLGAPDFFRGAREANLEAANAAEGRRWQRRFAYVAQLERRAARQPGRPQLAGGNPDRVGRPSLHQAERRADESLVLHRGSIHGG